MTSWQTLTTRIAARARSMAGAPLFVGVVLIVAGIALIAFGWGRIASLHDVSLQLPYIASTSFPGIALVICGVALALMGARSRDAAARAEQLDELAATLRAIREALSSAEPDRASGRSRKKTEPTGR
jgi:hypothetical protein